MPNHAEQLAQELNLNVKNVQGAIELIDQGNTIPFIARYRKEATGSMDDQVLRDLGDRLEYLRGLDKRKDEVTSSITEQGAMTPELTAALSKAKTLAEVEDIYRPYKPKRKTRASIAKARGLQPLATAIFRQDAAFDPERAAADYLNDEVPDAAAALAGAQDIIAEAVSDDACLPRRAAPLLPRVWPCRQRQGQGRGQRLRPVLRLRRAAEQDPRPPRAGTGPRRARGLFEGHDSGRRRACRGHRQLDVRPQKDRRQKRRACGCRRPRRLQPPHSSQS